MHDALYDEAASRRVIGLELNADLYDKARLAGLDATRIVEQALADALRAKQREVLRAEIEQDVLALAAYIAEHGDPSEELRAMFADGADDTA